MNLIFRSELLSENNFCRTKLQIKKGMRTLSKLFFVPDDVIIFFKNRIFAHLKLSRLNSKTILARKSESKSKLINKIQANEVFCANN